MVLCRDFERLLNLLKVDGGDEFADIYDTICYI